MALDHREAGHHDPFKKCRRTSTKWERLRRAKARQEGVWSPWATARPSVFWSWALPEELVLQRGRDRDSLNGMSQSVSGFSQTGAFAEGVLPWGRLPAVPAA